MSVSEVQPHPSIAHILEPVGIGYIDGAGRGGTEGFSNEDSRLVDIGYERTFAFYCGIAMFDYYYIVLGGMYPYFRGAADGVFDYSLEDYFWDRMVRGFYLFQNVGL